MRSPERTPADALRSLKRYVALALGDEFEVRLTVEDGTFKRPFAHVGQSVPAQYPTGGKFVAEVVAPMFIHVYPTGGATEDDSLLEAMRVEELLFQAFRVGIDEGRPLRVPLYDYTDVPLTDGSVGREHPDFMRVTDLSVGRLPDPDQRGLWAVTCDIRLGWRRTAAVVSQGRTVRSVDYTESAD